MKIDTTNLGVPNQQPNMGNAGTPANFQSTQQWQQQQAKNIQSFQQQSQPQASQQQPVATDFVDEFTDGDSEIVPDEFGFVDDDLQPTIIKTDGHKHDGQNKCPKCGATDISINPRTGKLRCNYCHYEFSAEGLDELNTNIANLHGQFIASGTQDIPESTEDVVTLKCTSCGAEVVVNTAESTQARCHWCRNYLSINNQLPNGSVPDAILPFAMTREEAQQHINQFVGSRKFYAHPKFKREFTTENITGVYFPYYLADLNTHADLSGVAQHETRRYTIGSGKDKETRYDANEYQIARSFDMVIDDLTVEASADKLNLTDNAKTTNIINSILPFDTQNCVRYDANYLRGFTSEKRDTNIEHVSNLVRTQAKDIARQQAAQTCGFYDRGVRWENEQLQVKGERWSTAYLPVWLYSYFHDKGNGQGQLHYVAVNGRTKETMGSVPIHYPKLALISAIIEIIALLIMIPILLADFSSDDPNGIELALAFAGFVYFFFIFARYRNKGARHSHETETPCGVANVQSQDVFIRERKGLKNPKIDGENTTAVQGTSVKLGVLEGFADSFVKR